MVTDIPYQSFKGPDGRVVKVETFFHEETAQHLVDWNDIMEVFSNVSYVLNGDTAVVRVKDSRRIPIEPRCIKYHQDTVLEVVVGDMFAAESAFSFSPPTSYRAAAIDAHTDSDVSFSRSRAESTSSSFSTAGNIFPSHSANTRAVGGPLPIPKINTPPHTKEQGEHNDVNLGYEAQLSNIEDSMEFQPQHRRVSTQDCMEVSTSAFNNESLHSTLNLPSPSLSTRTAVFRTRRPESIVQLEEYLKRLDSKVELYGHLLAQGQNEQALLVKQESESIRQQMEQYYDGLQTALAENEALQIQLNERMAEAERLSKRILELQENNHKQVMEELARVQSKATAILTQTYELHEFPIPRLFIVLPKEDITSTCEKIGTMFVDRFRLYFLCECGEHTRPKNGANSAPSHHIHLARHGGYDLDRPNEFFRKYGSYVLALLQMLKYGVVAAGMVAPALNALKVADEMEYVAKGMKSIMKDLIPQVDTAIKYLQDLKRVQDGTSKDLGEASSKATLVDPVSTAKLEGLEGADLRSLCSFLKGTDKDMVLGNLYRTATPEGHVKWVCLDHYRESYGKAAVEKFKRVVADYKGTYDQPTGRVAVRLESPVHARQFYNALMSARLVHELELMLDWNTAFDDLRILKEVVAQSNILRLVLDLCGKSSPMLDAFTRSHRSEPIVQILASAKIPMMTLKNITSFLYHAGDFFKTIKLQVRHFELGEQVVTVDDFARLESLICASQALTRLVIMVRDIEGAFKRLRPVALEHRSLSTLSLQLQDGTMATVEFEPGSDKVNTVSLKVVDPKLVKLSSLPTLTSVELMAKNHLIRSSQHIHHFIKSWRALKTITIAQLPDDGADLLRNLQWKVNEYFCQMEEGSVAEVDANQVDCSKAGPGYMELDSIHRRTVLWNMVLLLASFDEREAQEEATVATGGCMNRMRSIFLVQREDGSLASVQFELGNAGSTSAVLHVGDFDASEIYLNCSATKLTVIGGGGFGLMKMIRSSTMELGKLGTLEVECRHDNHLDILQHIHLASDQYPALTRLNLWNTTKKTKTEFSLPLHNLSLRQHIALEQLPLLYTLLRAAPKLATTTLLIPALFEAFKIVNSAIQSHKQLRRVQLIAGKSRALIEYTVGSGCVRSIELCIRETEINRLLKLPMVTELNLGAITELSRIKEVATVVFKHYEHLKTLKIDLCHDQHLAAIGTFCQAIQGTSVSCRLVLTEIDAGQPDRAMRLLDLPLKTLDLTWCLISPSDHPILERIIVASPSLLNLTIKVSMPLLVFKLVCSNTKKNGSLTQLQLLDKDGNEVTTKFKLGSGEVISVVMATKDNQKIMMEQDAPELTIANLSNPMLELIEAVQDVTMHKLGRKNLNIKDKDGNIIRTVDISSTKIDLGRRAIPLEQVKLLKRVLMACPQLMELCLTVDSVADLRETSAIFGPVFQKFKKLVDVQLRLQNGTEASVRYSSKDGTAASIALRTSDEFLANLSSMPMVKKISLRPKDITLWSDPSHINNELVRILDLYQDLETLELGWDVGCPFPALFSLQDYSRTHPSRPFRRLRHQSFKSTYFPITYDLPLQMTAFGGYPVRQEDLLFLQKLVSVSPLLTEIMLTVPSADTIDRVIDKLEELPEIFSRLKLVVLKSPDDYVMSRRLQAPIQRDEHSNTNLQQVYSVELHAAGNKCPSSLFCQRVTQLTVTPVATRSPRHLGPTSSLRNILSQAKHEFSKINHLVLTCSVLQFLDLLPLALEFGTVRRYDLKGPFLSNIVVSVSLDSEPTATVQLDSSLNQELLDAFSVIFSDYNCRVEIVHHRNKRPEINVSMDRPVDGEGKVIRRVVLESRDPHTLSTFMNKLSGLRNSGDQPSFTFKWWIEHAAGAASTDGRTKERRAYSDEILRNSKTMAAFINILTRRATDFSLDYEVMVALIPFVRSEIEKGTVGGLEPFCRLRQFSVDCEDESQELDFVLFRSMIPDRVEGSFHVSG
ncbi:hypothetical protein BGW39_000881 [Mortierella sp. 14UC]|nr:hypothetical protein BGW39_000881 [Mortierella sp. 14UC]